MQRVVAMLRSQSAVIGQLDQGPELDQGLARNGVGSRQAVRARSGLQIS